MSGRLIQTRGFTLLEVMVVLAIIAGLMGLVSLNSGDSRARDETERFATSLVVQMNIYNEEAVYRNQDYGLAMDRSDLLLLQWVDAEQAAASQDMSAEELDTLRKNPWQPFSDRYLGAPEVPEGISLTLIVDDDEVDYEALLDNEDGPLPALLFLASEEYTAFELMIENEADTSFAWVVKGDGYNPVWKELVSYEL